MAASALAIFRALRFGRPLLGVARARRAWLPPRGSAPPAARRLLKSLCAGALAFSAAAALVASQCALADGGAQPGEHDKAQALAMQRIVKWLAHARARAESLLAEPPAALARFGEDWRDLVSAELALELEERRAALRAALAAVSAPGGAGASERWAEPLEELAAAINAAEEVVRRVQQAAADGGAGGASWHELMREARVQRLDGSGGVAEADVPPDFLKGKVVLLYFTAGWCAPCRDFTPKLRAAADALGAEVLQVSWDHDERGMAEYTRSTGVTWLAVPYARRGVARELSRRFKVENLPALIVAAVGADGRSVEVLSSEGRLDVLRFLAGRERVRRGEAAETAPWIERLLRARRP